jgi:hypothetical protein
MANFGKAKNKILGLMVRSYGKKNKDEVKNVLKLISNNKDFKELYVLYEEIENKFFEDKEVAKLYVEELSNVLKDKSASISGVCKVIIDKYKENDIQENSLYNSLDLLTEKDSLLNLDKKILAKKTILEHLTTKKSITEEKLDKFTYNANFLHAIMANNFNTSFNNQLNEEEKKELKKILSYSDTELKNKTKKLKQSINEQIEKLLNENDANKDLQLKLKDVSKEVNEMDISKYNLYKLQELKNGLN